MKLRYLGTAAAEGWPAIFCECEACRKAREAKGRNIRTRSQALLDDRLLIDLPPDTYHHCLSFGLDLTHLENVIFTHSHGDHFYPEELTYRSDGFAVYGPNVKPLTVWGPSSVGQKLESLQQPGSFGDDGRVVYRPLTAFEPVVVDGYTVTPLPANHDPKATPLIFQITDGTRTLLYGNDTGLPGEAVWQYWKEHPVHFDFVSLDCTGGARQGWRDGHMCLETNRELVQKLRDAGLIGDTTVVCLTHFSHNGLLTYDELRPKADELGWLVAYDGMTVEF